MGAQMVGVCALGILPADPIDKPSIIKLPLTPNSNQLLVYSFTWVLAVPM